jgi:hypothetical protein
MRCRDPDDRVARSRQIFFTHVTSTRGSGFLALIPSHAISFTSGTSPLGSQECAAESEQKPIDAKTRNQPKAKQIEHATPDPVVSPYRTPMTPIILAFSDFVAGSTNRRRWAVLRIRPNSPGSRGPSAAIDDFRHRTSFPSKPRWQPALFRTRRALCLPVEPFRHLEEAGGRMFFGPTAHAFA